MVTLGAIVALAALLPVRTLTISADGSVTRSTSLSADDVSAVKQAGIEVKPGDVVESSGEDELSVRRATEVLLKVDGKAYALRTQAETVAEALIQAEVALAPDDSLLLNSDLVPPEAPIAVSTSDVRDGGTAAGAPVKLDVRRAVPFTVIENGQEIELQSSRKTVGAALRDVGTGLGPGDEIRPSPDTELTVGLKVRIEPAAEVAVPLPGGAVVLYTHADTVGEALAESSLRLPAKYRRGLTGDTPIAAGLSPQFVSQMVETERVRGATVREPDPTLSQGEQRVVTGRDGTVHRRYLVVLHGGKIVSRELLAEWYDPEPVDTVVYEGTAEARPSGSSQDWRQLVCSYDWDCAWALAVINCESGGDPAAYNPAGPYIGLFQVWGGFGGDLRDPAANIATAHSLYVSGGSGHWPHCP